jgi:hypothetical protein
MTEEERIRKAAREARFDAAPFAAAILVANVALAIVSRQAGWELFDASDWWAWLLVAAPSAVLVVRLLVGFGAHTVVRRRRRREVYALLGLLTLGNGAGMLCVIVSLTHWEPTGPQLLVTAAVVLMTNAITFALWFWAMDSGGPIRRALKGDHRRSPDFQFPQDDNPELAEEGWQPELVDYAYLSLTNSLAFSPTDVMPLSRRAKLLMGAESVVSVVTVLLVAARAINILE